jgi:hypothetical protein
MTGPAEPEDAPPVLAPWGATFGGPSIGRRGFGVRGAGGEGRVPDGEEAEEPMSERATASFDITRRAGRGQTVADPGGHVLTLDYELG